MAGIRQSPPPREIVPKHPDVARLLSYLASQYPGTREMLSRLHAMPEKLDVDLMNAKAIAPKVGKDVPLNLLGQYTWRQPLETPLARTVDPRPRDPKTLMLMPKQEVILSKYLDQPSAEFTAMHEMGHATDRNFGLPLSILRQQQVTPEQLTAWHKQNQPRAGSHEPMEALQDYRAAQTLGMTDPKTGAPAVTGNVMNQSPLDTVKSPSWAPMHPAWPVLRNNEVVDPAYMRRVLGDKVFEAIRSGEKFGPTVPSP